MTDNYPLRHYTDEEWKKLSDDEQDRHNRKVEAKDEYTEAKEAYETSMSYTGPLILFILGILGSFILGVYLAIGVLIIAILWVVIRVISRSHAYQRYKDTEKELKAAITE
jgi:hypothetical protein